MIYFRYLLTITVTGPVGDCVRFVSLGYYVIS